MRSEIEYFPLKYYLKSNDGGCWGDDPLGDQNDRLVLRSTEQEQDGKLKIENPAIRNLTPSEFESCRLKVNDIIITKSSGSPQHIGKSSIINNEIEELKCAFSNFIQRIRVDERVVSPRYLLFALNSNFVRGQFQLLTNSTVGLGNLNAEVVGNVSIPFLRLETQTKIANYLDRKTAEIDQLIGAKQRLLKLLDEKKRALIARAVTRGLNPDVPLKESGIPWLGMIPAHWKVERTKWLLPEIDERSETGEEDLLSVSHLTGVTLRSEKDVNMFMAESLEGYKKCKVGDLVINTLWAWMGAMGVSPVDGIISPAYNVYRPVSEMAPDYLDLLVRTPDFVCEITRYSKGVWSSRLRLYPEGLYEACLPVPPLSEQKKIVVEINEKLKRFKELKSITEKTIAFLHERRTALISAAVTGKLCDEILNAGIGTQTKEPVPNQAREHHPCPI